MHGDSRGDTALQYAMRYVPLLRGYDAFTSELTVQNDVN